MIIDVSTYQGTPNFQTVKAAGVTLCIMRSGYLTNGAFITDRVYLTNRTAARTAGLPVGNYLYNGPMDPATAANAQHTIMDYHPGEPVVIDVEGNAPWTPDNVLTWAQRMLALGVRIQDLGVYMSESLEQRLDWTPVANLGLFLWDADYNTNPPVKHWPHWTLWQYTSSGTIPGIAGRVDISNTIPGFPTPTTPTTKKRNIMNSYGLLKSDTTGNICLIRNIDGAAKSIGYIEYAGYLSTGLTVETVPDAQLTAYLTAHPWTEPTPPTNLLNDLTALITKYTT